MTPSIAIIGSTGMLGQPVTRAFVEAGFTVSVLVRDARKAQEMFGEEVHVSTGNVAHAADVREFLAGHTAVYMNLSVEQSSGIRDFQPERDGLETILRVAREVGIRRIGYLSSLIQFYTDVDWWVLDLKRAAVKSILESGIPYSIFYPSTFMECFDKGAYRQGPLIVLSGKARYPMFLIAGADYGKQVVQAFLRDDGNNDYVVQGKDGWIVDDAARLFAKNYHTSKVWVVKLPFRMLKALAPVTNKFNYAAHIIGALNDYPEKFEAERTWAELGVPETTFMEYIRKA